jgi:hypothetical protein
LPGNQLIEPGDSVGLIDGEIACDEWLGGPLKYGP